MVHEAGLEERPYAIVIGLDCMTGLQTTRILAGHGVPVIGLAQKPKHYCARTRLPRRVYGVDTATEDLIELLEQLAPQFTQKPVLVPCTDMSVYQMSKHRDRISDHYRFALPALRC